MPITVPKSNVSKFPGATGDMPIAPSEADMWMALAIMHGKGRFTQGLDPSKQGEIEDRQNMSPDELTAAENQSRKDRMLGWPKLESGAKVGALSAAQPPSRTGRISPKVSEIVGPERGDRESLGVLGGSR